MAYQLSNLATFPPVCQPEAGGNDPINLKKTLFLFATWYFREGLHHSGNLSPESGSQTLSSILNKSVIVGI